jgi:hypothetical protein
MAVKEIEWQDMDWLHFAQDRNEWQAVVSTVMNLQVPQNARNVSTS